jgi:hypothetical protein
VGTRSDEFQIWVDRARRVRIETEASRRSIALKKVSTVEFVGPCPACGGTDRFGLNIRKQVFRCRQCAPAGGDVIDFVQFLDGCDFKTACRKLTQEDRPAMKKPVVIAQVEKDRDTQQTRLCARIWNEGLPIEETIVDHYLRGRVHNIPPGVSGRVLRFHPACLFGLGTKHPCMIALFRSIDGDEPVAIHRTALTPAGKKIDRMALGPIRGAAIKLSADSEVMSGLTIGEGIETTLSGMMLGFRPAWAVGSSGAIRSFPVLHGIEALRILVDHDDPVTSGHGAGQSCAAACSKRWTAAGREVRRVIPRTQGADMADLATSS